MNYMTEIRMFYDWLLYNPLPTGSIALWQGLMSINNKAGWADEFTVANIVLQGITGLSRQGLDRARNQLIQKELITYKKGTSNQAGRYKIISFECKKVGTVAVTPKEEDVPECKKTGTEHDTRRSQDDTQDGHSSSTLNKLNETKLNNKIDKSINPPKAPFVDEDAKRVFDMWQSNIGIPSAIEIKNLFEWIKDLSVDAVCYAIEVVSTLDYDKRNYRYINGILNNWAKQSLTTVEAIKAYELSRQRKNVAPGKSEKNGFVKRTAFNSVQDREWNFEELAALEDERMKRNFEDVDGLDNEELKRRLRVVDGGIA